jgi:DNA-binding MarR family transcriptional regulator
VTQQGDSPPDGGPDAAPPIWLSESEQQAWRIMVAFHTRLMARLDAELQASESMSLRDYEVLVHLSEAEGSALRMAELAQRLFVTPSGLTRRLDGLVRSGLVRRQVCHQDRRGTLAVLTPKGRAALERAAPAHVASVRRYVFDPVDARQTQQMATTLQAMYTALDATAGSERVPAVPPEDD